MSLGVILVDSGFSFLFGAVTVCLTWGVVVGAGRGFWWSGGVDILWCW